MAEQVVWVILVFQLYQPLQVRTEDFIGFDIGSYTYQHCS
jgi:hypothetical protein